MQHKAISSTQHPLVKHLAKLREDSAYRRECGKALITGAHPLDELPADVQLHTLLVEQGTPLPKRRCAETFYVTPQVLKKVTGLQSPGAIAAEVAMPREADLATARYLLILDGVSDPGNLGTLLRTAKALGWEGAWLLPGSADPFNDKALRSAKGATFTLPWKKGTWEELSCFLSTRQMTLLAADMAGGDIALCTAAAPLALALGNEGHGLTPALKQSSQLVSIPMPGEMESLNVATAGAILMYSLKELRK